MENSNVNIEIYSDDRNSWIIIDWSCITNQYYPSLDLSVLISDNGFAGFNGSVNIDIEQYLIFIEQLKKLQITRKGSAILKSVTPNEFEFLIGSYDNTGHLLVKYTLSRNMYLDQSLIQRLVKGGFSIDSEYFNDIFDRFIELKLKVTSD